MKKKLLGIILLNVMLFFALLSIHEVVHVAVGVGLGCDFGRAVLMDSSFAGPYAEMACGNINQLLLYGSSLIATISFGMLFLSFNSGKNLFYVVLGISMIFSSLDIGLATLET